MPTVITQTLKQYGLTAQQIQDVKHFLQTLPAEQCWQKLTQEILTPQQKFDLHKFLYTQIFPNWADIPCPAWIPTPDFIKTTNIAQCLYELNLPNYESLHQWSVKNYHDFWRFIIQKLNIQFFKMYDEVVDLKAGVTAPRWLPGAKLNIVESCFKDSANDIAIVYQREQSAIQYITYSELNQLTNRVANSIVKLGYQKGDAIAVCLPMTLEAVAFYLGVIKMGANIVSIADSFSAEEIATRLKITKAKLIFTQDQIVRGGKVLPLYPRVKAAEAPRAIVLTNQENSSEKLRANDLTWNDFLVATDEFVTAACEPLDHINILFSSGTTGEPKAIPWNHTTAIRCAADAYFHHNMQKGDIFAWPTNLGWMMGPWLIFACLINQGTIALYDGLPNGRGFGEFVQNAKVNMLGLVPSIVKAWRNSACMEGLDWSNIKLFSSSGECSNTEDMLYLMHLAGYRPIIEYCGGTEIGGGYISSTMVQPNAPAAFTTAVVGYDFLILDESGHPADNGEVAIIPPTIGLSIELLNRDHYQVYYADMPKSPQGEVLRRHGDQIQRFANGYYRVLGRVDDTMNLGGIKVSSAEIERALIDIEGVLETAAIAVNPPGGGPSLLVIYAVPKNNAKLDIDEIKAKMQYAIKERLNPLFKIHDIVIVDLLPRTASNKVMRRVLRDRYKN